MSQNWTEKKKRQRKIGFLSFLWKMKGKNVGVFWIAVFLSWNYLFLMVLGSGDFLRVLLIKSVFMVLK
jgi:hypothetical protein